MPADLAEAQLVSGPPDGRAVRAVRLAYQYDAEGEPPGALRSGIAVPIQHDGHLLGFVAAYSLDAQLDETIVVESLETVAAAAAPTIVAVTHRPHGLREGASMVDSLTGLKNRTGFNRTLSRALARAQRDNRSLTLLILDVDGFRALNADFGQLVGDDVLRWTAARVRECLRDADVAARIGSDEFAVVLPDAMRADAEGLFARVQAMLLRQPPEAIPSVTLSGGIAAATDEDDVPSLLLRAEEGVRRARAAGRGTAA
ncbi:MAG: GGDEF domain-containing protein [Actinobacteria bacterium]|nr:GGDEF domain-containing protein [Actinomycetota bacterium]